MEIFGGVKYYSYLCSDALFLKNKGGTNCQGNYLVVTNIMCIFVAVPQTLWEGREEGRLESTRSYPCEILHYKDKHKKVTPQVVY